MNNLTPQQALVLSRIARKGDSKARAALAAGEYHVPSFTVTVKGGNIVVGDDEPYTPTVSIPLLATLTVALHRAGFQREGIAAIILNAATEAINTDRKVGGEIADLLDYVEDEVKALQARLSADLPDKVRAGKVKVTGIIE
ncbi:MAG: hypothetical protein EB075_09505 [Bacteroidetes bacterium]|nr:hypothetical protein [Bacteroidota bacterium]